MSAESAELPPKLSPDLMIADRLRYLRCERRPIAFMSANVAVDAITVLATVIALEHGPVLSVAAGLAAGASVGSLLYVAILQPRYLLSQKVRDRNFWVENMFSKNAVLICVSRFDWPIFALAVTLAGSLASAAVLGLSTMLYIVFTDRLTRKPDASSHDYHRIKPDDVFFMAVALGGMIIVLVSQDSGWAPFGAVPTIAGIAVAAVAALASASSAARFPAGHKIHTFLKDSDKPYRWRDECAATMFAMGTGSILTALVMVAVAASGTLFDPSEMPAFAYGFVIGAALPTTGVMLGSATNLNTRNLSLNAIAYFVPLASILVLIAAGLSQPVTIWLAALGGLIIALANLKLAQSRDGPYVAV